MNKRDEYEDWMREKLEQVYNQAWSDGKHALYTINTEEYKYLRDVCINEILTSEHK